jgi:hypothetical protein
MRTALGAVVLVVALACAPLAGGRELRSPRPWEAFFGAIRVRAPAGATYAELYVGNRRLSRRRVDRGRVAFRLDLPPGRYDLRVRYEAGSTLVRRDGSRSVWLLPRSAAGAVRDRVRDAGRSRRLAVLGRNFDGWAGLFVQDLTTGRTAGWNSDALFPAASTVKLGVLVAALRRFGPRPEWSRAWPEIRDLAVWSSNLASNRLLLRLGGSERAGARIAERTLHRIGATSSTFTGFYRLGTAAAAPAGDAPRPLPLVTYRRTTAHDLARILFELHAAAVGNGLALRRTGLTKHEARVAIGLLCSSDPRGANRGLFRPRLPRTPMAQKHGWTTSLRHSAAIVYGARGPTIVVVLTYRPKLRPEAAATLARRVLDVVEPD